MGYISKIKDTGGTSHPVSLSLYGTCSTAAGTAAKVVTCADWDTAAANIPTGTTIHVKFTNANTVASPTLNINNKGAINIYRYGTTATGTTAAIWWEAGSIVSFTYDGSAWIINSYKENSNTTYSAGNGLTLTSTTFNVGKRWTAVSQGQKWSRLYYATPVVATVGTSGILSITATRGSVVYNATFLITTSHAGSNYSHCTELDSCNYSQIRSRIVVKSDSTYYFEIYDTANGIASGTAQSWNCCFIPLADTTLTVYTAFTDGTTVPSGYTATNDFTTTGHNSASAIKNITRSGTTFTATRQDGSTFTFTQQDNNTDRYVNSASFADDSTNTSASPVKMTLTRAGSDTATVTGNIPKVSSSSAGVAPKGAAVSSQSQSTKFLREDGSWAAPSYTTNTDTKVKQTATTTDANYEVLFSETADNTTRTEGARKTSTLKFNPNSKALYTKNIYLASDATANSGVGGGFINNYGNSDFQQQKFTWNMTSTNSYMQLLNTHGTDVNSYRNCELNFTDGAAILKSTDSILLQSDGPDGGTIRISSDAAGQGTRIHSAATVYINHEDDLSNGSIVMGGTSTNISSSSTSITSATINLGASSSSTSVTLGNSSATTNIKGKAITINATSSSSTNTLTLQASGSTAGNIVISGGGSSGSVTMSTAPNGSATITSGTTSGNISITSSKGKVNITANSWDSATGTNCYISSAGKIVKYSSSRRYKTNIDYDIDREDYHDQLMQFQPCEYEYISLPGEQSLGLIAEDVYDVNPQLVNYNDDFEIESFRDRDILTMLVIEAQEKDKEISDLKQEVENLKYIVNQLTNSQGDSLWN